MPASSSSENPLAVVVPLHKRPLEVRPTETPVTEPPAHRPKTHNASEMHRRCGHATINQAGCPVKLDPERVSDGWYIAELSSDVLRVKSGTDHLSYGKHRLELLKFPLVSVYIQPEPGSGWFVEHCLVPRQYLSEHLDQVVHRVVQVFHPARRGQDTYEVNEAARELTLGESSSDDDAGDASVNRRLQRLVPKKLRKALDKELPFDLIPPEHRHLYAAALDREWDEWLS